MSGRLRLVGDSGDPTAESYPLSLEGRILVDADGAEGGVCFHYGEAADLVWATYAGGRIRRGFLLGTRTRSRLQYRFVEIDGDGRTAVGRCLGEISLRGDGRLCLHEAWVSESDRTAGARVVEELVGWDD